MSKVKTISITGIMSLNLHSLNNVKAEQNVGKSRTATIVDPQGKKYAVNSISGDMVKHILVEHLHNEVVNQGLVICDSCKKMDPNRFSASSQFEKNVNKTMSEKQLTDILLQHCSIDDIAGMMSTGSKAKTFNRKGVVEWGYIAALPDQVFSEKQFHVKLSKDSQAHKANEDKSESENQEAKRSNDGSAIIYRPINSGNYAFNLHLEVERLGMNDVDYSYAISDEDRVKRYQAMMKSVLYSFIKMSGALRNTLNPHVSYLNGVISYSTSSCPAPQISPLFEPNFVKETQKLVEILNGVEGANAIHALPFDSLSSFAQELGKLIALEPAKLGV